MSQRVLAVFILNESLIKAAEILRQDYIYTYTMMGYYEKIGIFKVCVLKRDTRPWSRIHQSTN